MSNIFDRDGEVKVFNGPRFTDKFLNAKINTEIERATNAEEEIRRLIVSGFIENIDGIIVIQNTSADISKYENNQLFFVTSEYKFYKKQNNSLVLYYDLNEYRNKIGIIILDVAFEDATLTTAQLSEVDKDFVVIIDSNNKAFIKDDSDNEYAVFFALDNITINDDVNNMYTRLTKDCFKVDLSSGDVIAVSNYYDVTKDIYTFKQVGVLDTSELVINYISKYGSHFEFSIDTYRQKRFFFTSGHRLFQNNYFGVAVFNESGIRYSGNTESTMDLTSLTLDALMSDTYRNDFITQKDTQTIPGSKTFSSVPQATSAPVNDNDLSRKSYVDTQDANKLTEAKSYSDANLVTAKSYTDSQKADLKSYVDNNYVNNSEKGTANGVASLDSSGQVPLSQIPVSITGQTEYCGKWDASSNVAQLTDDHPLRKGDYYICQTSGQYNPEGTKDSPVNDYVVGDWAIYNGDTWDMIDNTDAVYSVNKKTGAVVLDKTDIGLDNVDNTSDLNKPISTATQNALDSKLSKTEAGDVYQAKILHADITYIATSDWQQVVPVDAEPYYEWKNAETTDLYSILGVVNSDDLADLRGIDATTRAEMGEAGIYLYNVTTTNGHTYAYIRSKFQPSTVLNLTVTVTKQYANGGSVSDLLTTGDITGSNTIEFSNSKVEVKSSLVNTWNNKQDALTFDNAPTANSNNPVTSGGVYSALGSKQDNLTSSSVTSGTVAEVIGFDSSNNLIKGTVSSGPSQVTINVDINDSSSYSGTLSSADYTTLAGDNAYIKINFQDTGVTRYSATLYKKQDLSAIGMPIVYEMSVTTSASVSGVSITIATDDTRVYSIEENIYTPEGVSYITTAPSADNTDGDLKFVILSSEPATYYDGYLYIVTGGNQ